MGISFKETEGQAKKNQVDYFKFEDGKNKFRMVGDILPRYVYWAKSYDKQATLAIECLSFDRVQEKFTNIEKDWYSHYYPMEKCSWAYMIQVIDYSEKEPKLKVLALKKKLFQQIQETARKEEFGDPTDLETGWTCIVTRKKIGPQNFNVEYTLDQLDSLKEKRALNDKEKELIENMKPIDSLIPRQTPEEQKAFIERTIKNPPPDQANTDAEAVQDLDEDVPQ